MASKTLVVPITLVSIVCLGLIYDSLTNGCAAKCITISGLNFCI